MDEDLPYEWDPEKSSSNLLKHDIDFLDATEVFADPHCVTEAVTRIEYGEIRFKAIGKLDHRYFTVIYTDRPHARRIISARRSRPNERRAYDSGTTKS